MEGIPITGLDLEVPNQLFGICNVIYSTFCLLIHDFLLNNSNEISIDSRIPFLCSCVTHNINAVNPSRYMSSLLEISSLGQRLQHRAYLSCFLFTRGPVDHCVSLHSVPSNRNHFSVHEISSLTFIGISVSHFLPWALLTSLDSSDL